MGTLKLLSKECVCQETFMLNLKIRGDKLSENKNLIIVSLTMSSVPIRVYKRFTSDIKQYNGIYWVKLLDLMRKAEAYDLLVGMSNGEVMVEEAVENGSEKEPEKGEEKNEEKVETVKTFGGEVKV